jgi:B12-binding domain/radical SAM domain protein
VDDLLIFVMEGYNRYSVAALAGIIEQELPNLSVAFLQTRSGWDSQVRKLAAQHRRIVLAFSFMTPQLPEILPALEALQPLPENVTLVAGGPHASGDPVGTLEMGFEVVVTGEGEVTFPALLRRILAGQAYDDVPGLTFLAEGKVIRNRRGPWVSLDDYPPFSIKHRKLAAIEITRACSFCQTPFFLGGKMRYRSVDQIVHWLKKAKEEVGMKYARFISADCFCYGSPDGRQPDLDQVEKLLRAVSGMMGRDNTFFGSFPSEVRPGSASREGIELLKKYSANDNIVIGAQSGSPRMLAAIHRGHTIEQVYETAEIVVGAGLKCLVDFIFGLPGETPEDRDLTMEAIRRLTGLGATINSHFFYPLPGTPLAHTVAGAPDPETLLFLERLTSEKLELGRWKGRLKTLAAMEMLPVLAQ